MCESLKHQFFCLMRMDLFFSQVFMVLVLTPLQRGWLSLLGCPQAQQNSMRRSSCPQRTHVLIGKLTFFSGPLCTASSKHLCDYVLFSSSVQHWSREHRLRVGSRVKKRRRQIYWGFYGETVSISDCGQKERRPRGVWRWVGSWR